MNLSAQSFPRTNEPVILNRFLEGVVIGFLSVVIFCQWLYPILQVWLSLFLK